MSRELLRIASFSTIGLALAGCAAESELPGPGEHVEVAPPQADTDAPLAGRFYAEISPKAGQIRIYPLFEGDVIYRDPLAAALAFTFGGNVACTVDGDCSGSITLNTPQDEITYISDEAGDFGTCYSNGLLCGQPGAAPAPTTAPCNVPGMFCAPLELTSSLGTPLHNVVVQIGQVGGTCGAQTNCLLGCADTAAAGSNAGTFGACNATESTRVDSASSTLTSVITSVDGDAPLGCTMCYGNRDTATDAGLPGLRGVLLPGVGTQDVYTVTVATKMKAATDALVSFDVRYTTPGFNASGSQLVQRDGSGNVRTCVDETVGSVEVLGGGFGPPAECLSGGMPGSCPLSGTAPDTADGYSMQFGLVGGGFVTAGGADYISWSDGAARVRVPSSGAGTFNGVVRVVTPTGSADTSDTFTICAGPPNCSNGVLNSPPETDVDCGGNTGCPRCGTGDLCLINSDCASNSCVGNVCQAVSCSDGILNGSESDVDCGGSCPTDCDIGELCDSDDDCSTSFCPTNLATRRCGELGCADGTREGFLDETTFTNIAGCGGGWSVAGLGTGRACSGSGGTGDDSTNATGSGCAALDLCQAGWGICDTRQDAAANLPGGQTCSAATTGTTGSLFFASQESSVGSGVCTNDDPLNNGTNDFWGCGNQGTAVPGSFPACGPFNRFTNDTCSALTTGGWSCPGGTNEVNSVTKSQATGGGVLCCRGCGDGVENGSETDVDCGGGTCSPCAGGQGCSVDSDCVTNLCTGGTCALVATCSDGAQNQTETDVDCGGASGCPDCVNGDSCLANGDCTVNICGTNFLCGREDGGMCGSGFQCQSGVCTGGVCQPPSCTDGVQNQTETDVDCGGSSGCPTCAIGDSCGVDADCASDHCVNGTCGQTGCADGGREGFTNESVYPNVAACGGGWSVAGLDTAAACSRQSGDDSSNPTGSGCSAGDLCQAGFHVCATRQEYAADAAQANCNNAVPSGNLFFASRESSIGSGVCTNDDPNNTGANDFWGCGSYGVANTCGAFNRFTTNLCVGLTGTEPGWNCGSDGFAERTNVVKTTSTGGGVLCCRD